MDIYELARELQITYGEDNVRVEAGYIFVTIDIFKTYRISIDRVRDKEGL